MPELRFADGALVRADTLVGDPRCLSVGPGVSVFCEELRIDGPVKLGTLDGDGFREPSSSQIRVSRLHLGDGCSIGRGVFLEGGKVWLGRGVRIGHRATVKVKESLTLGTASVAHERAEIAGRSVALGRRAWILPEAKIGGGSCFEPQSRLSAGPWLHLGVRGFINTARPVVIGREVGLGTGTSLYTHGAYPSALDGKPFSFGAIEIGDRTWIPGAVVNPGIRIGADTVVGVGSVVTRDIPEGCLAGGVPARVLRERCFPKLLSADELSSFFNEFLRVLAEILADSEPIRFEITDQHTSIEGSRVRIVYAADPATPLPSSQTRPIVIGKTGCRAFEADRATTIDIVTGRVSGPACQHSEKTLDQLRRYGIRFDYEALNHGYAAWQPEGPSWAS